MCETNDHLLLAGAWWINSPFYSLTTIPFSSFLLFQTSRLMKLCATERKANTITKLWQKWEKQNVPMIIIICKVELTSQIIAEILCMVSILCGVFMYFLRKCHAIHGTLNK